MAADYRDTRNEALSSLPYQVLLYFGSWYFAMFILLHALLLTYKGLILPYPVVNMVSEILLLLFLSGIEGIRLFLGKKGNLTETVLSVAVSLGMTIPSVTAVIYFLLWQTYVLRLEVILCSFQLFFQGLQTLFGTLAIITFARAPSQFG